MNIDDLNTTQSQKGPEDRKFFKNADIPFDESKEEIWNKISTRIENVALSRPKTSFISALWFKLVTAFVVILVGAVLFIQFYTTEITANRGTRESHVFPDGSTVELNADSRIMYKPYLWDNQRSVELSGEAFFDVKEGQPFIVVSDNGITKVLGTRFNINTRDDGYKVYCEEGAVNVFSVISKKDLTISAGEMAVIYDVTGVGVIMKDIGNEVLSWKSDKFNFNKVPLDRVLENLEIQYNIGISTDIQNLSTYTYTGRFNKTKSPETALHIICQSFNLDFKKLDSKNYKVISTR